MPPSPALRCSPGRELRAESHKRGHSFESGTLFREKDDDLALFNEMQTRECNNFLLQSADDFEDTFSTKLRYFSDLKLGISIPARGESSDLLNADGEKNDYDWLLTPPDTPLFPSLDDEAPPVNLAHRGRQRSQPISISRSSTMEKSHRSSRGSASPHRLSPSPRSGSNTLQSRGRPSSAPHSSPTSSIRHVTPSRRPSPPPSKPSTRAPRSSTPTPRRMSTGSSGTVASPGVRGTSPVKTSRGNSASPKIRAWQSNIPGFSSDPPPNLRTSLADRPASYVRGSSPASRNGRDSSSKFGRQSMSPTASRSVCSSFSQERDRFSSHSKGSVVSSGDDDIDSLHSVPVGSSDRSASRRVGAFPNNRAPALSKKPAKTLSPSSAPKRSFDYALRQMDHRKSPQNMFRPLLSSVPSTTFYVGKASSAHRTIVSRNSSVTTSSNASSDQGTSVAPDTEGSDQNQDDMANEYGKAQYPDVQDEVFVFDKVDVVNEDIGHKIHDGSLNIQHSDNVRGPTLESDHGDSEDFSHHDTAVAISMTSEGVKGDFPEVDNLEDMLLCSKCGCRYSATESVERDVKLCTDCRRKDGLLTVTAPVITLRVAENTPVLSIKTSEEYGLSDNLEPLMAVTESSEVTNVVEPRVSQHEDNVKQGQTCFGERSQSDLQDNSLARLLVEKGEQRLVHQQEISQTTVGYSVPDSSSGCQQLQHFSDYPNSKVDLQDNSLARSLVEKGEQRLVNQQEISQTTVGYSLPDSGSRCQQLQHLSDYPNSKVAVSEGAGISVLLLKRSSSIKGPVVQGRNFTATMIPYDDPSYARDSANSMRSSIGQGNASASSSVDLSSARHAETRVQRQLSGKKSDMENYRYDINTIPQTTGSPFSGISNYAYQASGLATSTHEENLGISVRNLEDDAVEETPVASQELVLASAIAEEDDLNASYTRTTILEEDNFECNESCRTMDASTSELSSHTVSIRLVDNSLALFPNNEDCVSCENGEDFLNNARSVSDIDASVTPESSLDEEHINLNTGVDGVDVAEVSTRNSLGTISEIEIENGHQSTHGSETVVGPPNSKSTADGLQDPSVPTSEKDLTASVPEPNTSNPAHGILEESIVMVEGRRGSHARSLTLEEATDTILFCSSIVQDLAYHAAAIAMEKENLAPLEGSHPSVTILGKSSSDRKDPRGRIASKRSSKFQKARQRRVETETKSPSGKTESHDVKTDESFPRNVGLPDKADGTRPPKLESKCNCTIM